MVVAVLEHDEGLGWDQSARDESRRRFGVLVKIAIAYRSRPHYLNDTMRRALKRSKVGKWPDHAETKTKMARNWPRRRDHPSI